MLHAPSTDKWGKKSEFYHYSMCEIIMEAKDDNNSLTIDNYLMNLCADILPLSYCALNSVL